MSFFRPGDMNHVLVFLLVLAFPSRAVAQIGRADVVDSKPRVIISADFPPLDVIPGGAGHGPAEKRSDPDDVQSMVRFLLYTNEFDVEGLIAPSATFANVANKKNIMPFVVWLVWFVRG